MFSIYPATYYKNGQFTAFPSPYFRLFNTVDSKQMLNIKFSRRLDSNGGPLVL